MRLVYVIGEPGVGKSTAVRLALRGLSQSERTRPFRHVEYRRPGALGLPLVCTLGGSRGQYPGTDTLSFAVLSKAREWIAERPCPLVLGEGDRLATPKFWDAAEAAGYDVVVLWLDGPAEERRRARGSEQDETWLRGRQTKVQNLSKDSRVLRLDASGGKAEVAAAVAAHVGVGG